MGTEKFPGPLFYETKFWGYDFIVPISNSKTALIVELSPITNFI